MAAKDRPRAAVDDDVKARFRAALDDKQAHRAADAAERRRARQGRPRARARDQRAPADVPPQERLTTAPRTRRRRVPSG